MSLFRKTISGLWLISSVLTLVGNPLGVFTFIITTILLSSNIGLTKKERVE